MSVHSEIQNVKHNKSGDAVLCVHSRAGEQEDGDSYFDLCAAKTRSPEEIVINSGQARARTAFLKAYFGILSKELDSKELRFLKLKIKTKKPDKLIAAWCGLSYQDLYKRIRKKTETRAEEIEELIYSSGWDNAELFSKMFLRSLKELSKEKDLIEHERDNSQDDFDELARVREYCALRDKIITSNEERHRIYSRGFEAGKRKTEDAGLIKEFYDVVMAGIASLAYIRGFIENGNASTVLCAFIDSIIKLFDSHARKLSERRNNVAARGGQISKSMHVANVQREQARLF